jgi:hypothetical protein
MIARIFLYFQCVSHLCNPLKTGEIRDLLAFSEIFFPSGLPGSGLSDLPH